MGLWIRTKRKAGKCGSTIETVRPVNGRAFKLSELEAYVNGPIGRMPLNDGRIMWTNQNSWKLPVNLVADQIAHDQTGIPLEEHVYGDVLVCSRAESGEENAAA